MEKSVSENEKKGFLKRHAFVTLKFQVISAY